MKNLKILIVWIVALPLLFTSCSQGVETGEGAVNLLCDCFIEAGIENEYDIMDIEQDEDKAKEVVKCILPIMKDIRSELDDMKDEERAEYFGDAIKAVVDCDCGVKLLEIAAKLYDEDEVEDGLDDAIQAIEWLGGYYGGGLFGIGGNSYYDDYYYDDYGYDDEYYDYDYPVEVAAEEDCYGDYYSLETDLINIFMDEIAYGNIVLGETTWSEMYDLTDYPDGFDEDYDGMYVSGYFEYDEDDVLQYMSFEYYYECEGVLDYVDMDQSSLTYAIEASLDQEGTYDEYDDYYYDDNPGVEWYVDDMTIRQANFSDGFAIYVEYDGYYDDY